VDAWVTDTRGVSWVRPEGSGYGCLALPPGTNDLAFTAALHARHGVLVIPGSLWEQPGSIRLAWLQASTPELESGLERVALAVAEGEGRTRGAPGAGDGG
jgi:aspartate/methionine/tyrosine aminotransferase